MLDVKGRTLLGRVIDRLSQAEKLSKIIVATSDHESDHSIAEFCASEAIECIRGSLDDVADRFCQVVRQQCAEAFVRISGDSPLIDPDIVDRAVGYFQEGECDLVTNVLTRSFPKGQSVEVLLSETFIKTCTIIVTKDQREHVTKAYYENPTAFRIVSFSSGMDMGQINLSVDRADDLARVERILERSGNKPGDWRALASICESLESWSGNR